MSRFFIPTNKPGDWKNLLAEPNKHWKTGYSSKALAYCWQEANGFPPEVRRLFKKSGIKTFQNVKMLVAFPEYKVPLPGGLRASQNDIFILANGDNQLISIAVEGKVSEPFGETVAEWKAKYGKGKKERLDYLCSLLQLDKTHIDYIRYQLLHRTASAIIEANRFHARSALMLVHSFSQIDEWSDDYHEFLALFGARGEVDSLVFAKNISGTDLYFGWVKGNRRYLEI